MSSVRVGEAAFKELRDGFQGRDGSQDEGYDEARTLFDAMIGAAPGRGEVPRAGSNPPGRCPPSHG